MTSAVHRLCTFYVDDLLCGLEVEKVQEVIQYQPMTRIPLAPWVVRGLINLRGQIVAAVDVRRCLELSDRPEGRLPKNIVIRTDDGGLSLLVDAVGDVLEVAETSFEPPPETLAGTARSLIRGAYKLDHQLLLLLDVDALIALSAVR